MSEEVVTDCVCIAGFGFDAEVLAPLVTVVTGHRQMRCHWIGLNTLPPDLEQAVKVLAQRLPQRHTIISWSLGGNLALAYTSAYPQRVQRLHLFRTNPKFIASDDWPGMASTQFVSFKQLLDKHITLACRRFLALQLGHGQRPTKRWQRWVQGLLSLPQWSVRCRMAWLSQLAAVDQRHLILHAQLPPTVWWFGAKDQLLPRHLAQHLQVHCNAKTVMTGLGHFPY